MITTTLIYDRRKKADKEHAGMVEIRVTIERKSYYISTGVRVHRRKWRDGRIINCEDAPELNERLKLLVAKTNSIVNEYIDKGMAINVQEIKDAVLVAVRTGGSKRNDMLNWLDEQIDTLRFAKGTMRHYKSLTNRLEEFGQMTKWADLTIENIYKFDAWLHELPGRGECISDGGVYNYHKSLKALLRRAELFGMIERNPYDKLRGQFKRGDVARTEYLTEEEMETIRNMKLQTGSELGKARDLFVVQMYTGMAYADVQKFDIADYKKVDDVWENTSERVKTGVAYISELLPPVVEVLERNNFQLPKLSNQAYNRALKVVGEKAEIATPLHSHLARHSFATMMLKNGVEIENLARMMGHTNITQTQRYAKVLAESVHEDFKKIRKKMTEGKPKKRHS